MCIQGDLISTRAVGSLNTGDIISVRVGGDLRSWDLTSKKLGDVVYTRGSDQYSGSWKPEYRRYDQCQGRWRPANLGSDHYKAR